MRIIILTTWLAPYRIDLYNEVAKQANVTVMYVDTTTSERNKNWGAQMSDRCAYIQMTRGIRLPVLGQTFPEFIEEMSHNADYYDIVYVDGYASLGLIQAINYLSRHRIPYFVNIDGALIRDKESVLVRRFKRWIMLRNCSYLCGSKITNNYLKRYGVKDNQIYNHPFTSLYRKDIIDRAIDNHIKLDYREELGLTEKYIIISVGRFSYKKGYGKGYDAIIRAAARMSSEYGFYIIGDEPTDEFVKMKAEYGASNVHFVDFKQKDELKKYYQASDVFVLMTIYDVWGLVVNEAMSNGLPVITTDMCVAGLELIRNGENGYVIPVGDDVALQKRINEICGSASFSKMQINAITTIKPYTIENVAQKHIDVFNNFIAAKRNAKSDYKRR